MPNSRILGVGHYVPAQAMTNHDLEALMDTSHDWILQRTGIEERRVVTDESTADLGFEAARNAIADAGLEPGDIDFIIFATLSPDYFFPGCGVLLQERFGISEIPALDIRQQCSGFVYGIAVADQFIKCGTYRNVLVVGAEVQSKGLNYTTEGRDLAVIFGDGAGAVVMGATEEEGVLSFHLHSQGKHYNMLWMERPGSAHRPFISKDDLDEGRHYPKMEGQTVFKHATRRFAEVIREGLAANNLTLDDVDCFFFHQANLRIIEMLCKTMKIPAEKTFNNIHKYGNTTAASIPLCISEASQAGRIKRGDLICPVAFGSGFTWASALIRW